MLNSTIATYGKTIEAISKATGVIEELMYAFVWVESAGDRWATTGRMGRKSLPAVGLMQIDAPSAMVAIFLANRRGLLSAELRALLAHYAGAETLACVLTMKNQTLPTCKKLITRQQLIESPALNLLCGAIYLMVLLHQYSENGTARLDKVVVAYNRGLNVERKLFSMQNLSPEQVYSGLVRSKMDTSKAKITQNYLAKTIGPSGMLTALLNPQALKYA